MTKTIAKPQTAAAQNSNSKAAKSGNQNIQIRTQFLKTENDLNTKQSVNEEIPESMHELIKMGQEINNNRPKESKGHRSSEKRHLINGSIGQINNHTTGAAPSTSNLNSGGFSLNTSQIKQMKIKNDNFILSPQSQKSSANKMDFQPKKQIVGDKDQEINFNDLNDGMQSKNNQSFKSQTLKFPSSFNSQLGDDFINLFANK